MTFSVPQEQWSRARTALRTGGERFRSLLADGADPGAMATPDWTVADTAAHVAGIAVMYTTLITDGGATLPIPGLAEAVEATTVDTVTDLNALVLRHFTERDPANLAALLDYACTQLLDATVDVPPETVVPWLGDSRVTVAGLFAHLVNEFLLHGHDMAAALRRDWPIPDQDAALYWELFFLGMLRHDYGALLTTNQWMPKRPVSVRFASDHTSTATIVVGDGRVRLGAPDERCDVRVRFRPAGFNKLLFGRTGTLAAALRRDVVVSGARPWRLPEFLKIVHMPNPRWRTPALA